MDDFAPFTRETAPAQPPPAHDGTGDLPAMQPVPFTPPAPAAPSAADEVPPPSAEPQEQPTAEPPPPEVAPVSDATQELERLKVALAEAETQRDVVQRQQQDALDRQKRELEAAHAEALARCQACCDQQLQQHINDLLRCRELGIDDAEFVQEFFARYQAKVQAESERDAARRECGKLQAQQLETARALQGQTAQCTQAEQRLQIVSKESQRLRAALQEQDLARSQETHLRKTVEAKLSVCQQQLETLEQKQKAWEELYKQLLLTGWDACQEVNTLGNTLATAVAKGELEPLTLQTALALATWRAMELSTEVLPRVTLCHLELLGRLLAQLWNADPAPLARMAQCLNSSPLMRKLNIRLEVPAAGGEVDTARVRNLRSGTHIRRVLVWGIVQDERLQLSAEVE